MFIFPPIFFSALSMTLSWLEPTAFFSTWNITLNFSVPALYVQLCNNSFYSKAVYFEFPVVIPIYACFRKNINISQNLLFCISRDGKNVAQILIRFSRKLSQKYKNKIICRPPLAFTAFKRAIKIVVALYKYSHFRINPQW